MFIIISLDVFVFIWCDGKLLVVKNSYKAYHSLPGGLLKKGEEPDLGAIRETEEEVGVLLSAERLIMHEPIIDQFGGIAYIAEIYLDQQPAISIDQREIVWADFVSREDALSMVLAEEVRDWLISHPDAGMR